ncbi:hypothetical protein HZA56_18110 [Candidatus Poribacteria bacterium]|nr:hypothetical protein [Candidatus Poribacteria bacterium]
MKIIVPALVTDDESVVLLDRTIRAIPSNSNAELFLVTQGMRPTLPDYNHLRALHWSHFDTPLKKWGAVREAVASIPIDSEPVMLLDADNSIAADSLQGLCTYCAREEVAFLVGERDRIALGAADQLSPNSRLYLEIFTNTLLLIVLDEVRPEATQYPDVQSGLYVVRSDLLHSIDFSGVGNYGGELLLYHDLCRTGVQPKSYPIISVARTRSSYSLRTIIDDTFNLRFFRGVPSNVVQRAKMIAPTLYSRYLDAATIDHFTSEIDRMLRLPLTH